MNTYYFQAKLAANPQAVPSSAGSQSTGTASFAIKQNGSVLMDITWDIVGDDGPIDANNALLGIHIHSGDEYTNGPIVFGFCGQDPLPPFNGKCQQGWSYGSGQVATQYSGKVCDMPPSAPCYNDGRSSAARAVHDIISGKDMYVNIHTTKSLAANGNAGPLGLIRGQLYPVDQHGLPMTTTTSREMTADTNIDADANADTDMTMLRRTRNVNHYIDGTSSGSSFTSLAGSALIYVISVVYFLMM